LVAVTLAALRLRSKSVAQRVTQEDTLSGDSVSITPSEKLTPDQSGATGFQQSLPTLKKTTGLNDGRDGTRIPCGITRTARQHDALVAIERVTMSVNGTSDARRGNKVF